MQKVEVIQSIRSDIKAEKKTMQRTKKLQKGFIAAY